MHLLQERSIDYNFIFIAQHRETIYEMLDDFNIKKPDYVLCDTGSDIVSSKQMIIWIESKFNFAYVHAGYFINPMNEYIFSSTIPL